MKNLNTKILSALLVMSLILGQGWININTVSADEPETKEVKEVLDVDYVSTKEVVDIADNENTNDGYGSKTIVVTADLLTNDYGAVSVSKWKETNQYILTFNTEEETKTAFDKLSAVYDCYINQNVETSLQETFDPFWDADRINKKLNESAKNYGTDISIADTSTAKVNRGYGTNLMGISDYNKFNQNGVESYLYALEYKSFGENLIMDPITDYTSIEALGIGESPYYRDLRSIPGGKHYSKNWVQNPSTGYLYNALNANGIVKPTVKICMIDSGLNAYSYNDAFHKIYRVSNLHYRDFTKDGYTKEDAVGRYTDQQNHGSAVTAIVVDGLMKSELEGYYENQCDIGTSGDEWQNIYDLSVYDVIDKNGQVISSMELATVLQTAVDNDMDVINLSLDVINSNADKLNFLDVPLKNAYDKNIVVISAAGNETDGITDVKYSYPANSPYTVTVAGLATDDFSVDGDAVDFCATGRTLANVMLEEDRGQRIMNVKGTSFSAPQYVPVFAMLKRMYPEYTVEQLKQIVYDSSYREDGFTRGDGMYVAPMSKFYGQRNNPGVTIYDDCNEKILDYAVKFFDFTKENNKKVEAESQSISESISEAESIREYERESMDKEREESDIRTQLGLEDAAHEDDIEKGYTNQVKQTISVSYKKKMTVKRKSIKKICKKNKLKKASIYVITATSSAKPAKSNITYSKVKLTKKKGKKFKKVDKKTNKMFTVTKAGNIKVSKNVKKGTYKLKVKVSAATVKKRETKNYTRVVPFYDTYITHNSTRYIATKYMPTQKTVTIEIKIK